MRNNIKLSELELGVRAIVLDIDLGGDLRRRLQDLGLINGTEVTRLLISPLGDPAAFLIRGAVVALRNDDSARIAIAPCDDERNDHYRF